ncbi:MAG: WG repeat-containing protein [Flavobacteriales bacterium]|nr:WG repeat-containing protein [Flavobacteriales bacterium]
MKIKSLLVTVAIVFSGVVNAQQIAAIAKEGTKVGFIDKTGNWLIEPKFDIVQTFKGDYALAKTSNLWGMINKKGEWVIPAKFERLSIPEDGYSMAMLSGQWIVVNKTGKTVYKNTEYKKIAKLGNGMLIGFLKKTAEYIDVSTGKKVATPIETKALNKFSEGLARFKEKKWGYLDKTGKYKIKSQFDDAKDFKDGKALVKLAGKWGQIDLSGAWVIPAEFEKIQGFKNGQAIAKQNGKTGIIDEKGGWVVKPQYEKLRLFNSGYAFATKGGIVGYVNESGEFVKGPSNATSIYPFSDGYAMVKVGDLLGYMNTEMKIVIEPKYVKALDWGGPFGRVMIDEKWAFVNESGEEFKVPNAQKLYKFHGGLVAVKANNQYGYVDKTGSVVIKPTYASIEDEYLYNATSKGGFGMLAKTIYEAPNRDKNGFILVKRGSKYGAIDKTGKEVIPFRFDDIKAFYPF